MTGTTLTTADLVEIRAVLDLYALACDERTFERLRDCFTEDVEAEYSGKRLPPGVAEVIGYVSPLASLPMSHHQVGTVVAEPDPEGARVTSYTVARLVRATDDGHEVAHRGLRYDDLFVRTAPGWRIRSRRHRALWATREPIDWPV